MIDQMPDVLQVTIITGMSGAGKSLAANTFEDAGYFCIDNMPPQMMPALLDVIGLAPGKIAKVALVFDIRGREFFSEVGRALEALQARNIPFRVVFLEADDQTLIARYQATRRSHPLGGKGSLVDGIRRERELLAPLRDRADIVLDTSSMNVHELRRAIEESVLAGELGNRVLVSCLSFGYKYGLPMEADLVFDARFLPNPHWVPDLRPLTGLDQAVRDYVLGRAEALGFLERASSLVKYLVPLYLGERKTHVVIAVGCTGGRHRSVVLAEALAELLRSDGSVDVSVRHRDLGRED